MFGFTLLNFVEWHTVFVSCLKSISFISQQRLISPIPPFSGNFSVAHLKAKEPLQVFSCSQSRSAPLARQADCLGTFSSFLPSSHLSSPQERCPKSRRRRASAGQVVMTPNRENVYICTCSTCTLAEFRHFMRVKTFLKVVCFGFFCAE